MFDAGIAIASPYHLTNMFEPTKEDLAEYARIKVFYESITVYDKIDAMYSQSEGESSDDEGSSIGE